MDLIKGCGHTVQQYLHGMLYATLCVHFDFVAHSISHATNQKKNDRVYLGVDMLRFCCMQCVHDIASCATVSGP